MAEGTCCRNTAIVLIVFAVVITAIGLVSVSLRKLEETEVAFKYDTTAKYLDNELKTAGLHAGPPGYEMIVFPAIFKNMMFSEVECLNGDGVEIKLNISFQYRPRQNAADLLTIVKSFKDFNGYQKALKSAGVAAIYQACSEFHTETIVNRVEFQNKTKRLMKERYRELLCDVSDLQVSNIMRPEEYEKALEVKESTRQNIKVAERERPRLITSSRTKLKEAEKQANITLQKAYLEARLAISRAEAQRAVILNQYRTEAEAYKVLLSSSGLNMTIDGMLAYLATRVLGTSSNPVFVGLKEPASTEFGGG